MFVAQVDRDSNPMVILFFILIPYEAIEIEAKKISGSFTIDWNPF